MTDTPVKSPEELALPEKITLRTPFPPDVIGKLPQPLSSGSPKSTCSVCGGYHGQPSIHLDYVGHAAVTDRLLTVDPEWNWEPLALDEYGLPAYDGNGRLWIKLTIKGVTRLGVGDGDSAKIRIGDAIRNAAMRFGVALDLWTKNDLESLIDEGSETNRQEPPKSSTPSSPDASRAGGEIDTNLMTPAQRNKIIKHLSDLDLPIRGDAAVRAHLSALLGVDETLTTLTTLTVEQGLEIVRFLGVPDLLDDKGL